MEIPFFQPAVATYDHADAVSACLNEGRFGPGIGCDRMEEKLRVVADLPAVLFSSGTAALTAIFMGLDPRPKQISMPMWGINADLSAVQLGAPGTNINFIELDRATGNMNLGMVSEYSDTVLYVLQSGCMLEADVALLNNLTARGVRVVVDAACAIGNPILKKLSSAHAIALSFSTPKLVQCGQGGAVLSCDPNLYKMLRNHGNGYGLKGSNLRMTDMQAAFLDVDFSLLPHRLEHRAAILKVLGRSSNGLPLHNIYFCGHRDREDVKLALRRRGIEAKIQYNWLPDLHWQQHTGQEMNLSSIQVHRYPGAAKWHQEALFLPFGNGLTIEQAEYMRDAIASL